MIGFLVSLLVIMLVLGIIWYFMGMFLPATMLPVARMVFSVIAVLIILFLVLQLLDMAPWGHTRLGRLP